MSPNIAYFFRRLYGNIIKWWFVIYNPIARKIWPTKEEEEEALANEEDNEQEEEPVSAYEDTSYEDTGFDDGFNTMNEEEYFGEEDVAYEEPAPAPKPANVNISDCNYNATTGAYSGLYGTGPMDSSTQSMLDEIMGRNNAAHSIDSLIPDSAPSSTPADNSEVLAEANEIYERLMREAAEDEAKKQAEIDAAKAAQM